MPKAKPISWVKASDGRAHATERANSSRGCRTLCDDVLANGTFTQLSKGSSKQAPDNACTHCLNISGVRP